MNQFMKILEWSDKEETSWNFETIRLYYFLMKVLPYSVFVEISSNLAEK